MTPQEKPRARLDPTHQQIAFEIGGRIQLSPPFGRASDLLPRKSALLLPSIAPALAAANGRQARFAKPALACATYAGVFNLAGDRAFPISHQGSECVVAKG